MFAKLLKQDCKAMFKYWWILSVISFGVSIIGGIAYKIMMVPYTAHEYIQVAAIAIFIFSVIAVVALPAISQIMMFIRFRKNFFTDEGYLTFTLPVNKSQLLGAKTLTAFIFSVASSVVLYLNILIMEGVEDIQVVITTIRRWANLFELVFKHFEIATFIALIIIFLISVVAIFLLNLFVFLCITVSNMLVKKRRLLFGLAFFYGLIMAFVLVLLFLSSNGIFEAVIGVKTGSDWYYVLVFFAVLCIEALFAAGLYLIELRLLDKRLNLE